MTREYLHVTPTSARLDVDVISTALTSQHKLSANESDGIVTRFNPFRSEQPVTFEFVAISEGKHEPVEFYHGADARLDVLRQRLRLIYPDSFDIDQVEVDVLKKLIQPTEYGPTEYKERAEEGRLLDPDSIDSLTDLSAHVGADGGRIRGRPSLEDVTPYGVRWRGSVARRKDWMTSLTHFSEAIGRNRGQPEDEDHQSGRAPLAPLIDQLTKASQPMAFQVVFKRKPDWSRHARRRAGELLAGKDTLLQKLLSIESPESRRASHRGMRGARGRGRRHGARWGDRPTHQPLMRDRERDQNTETRLDQLRENTPKRTFTANARLLALPTDDDTDDFEPLLESLCSVFDPIDGPHYEIQGKRFRECGLLPFASDRRAQAELEWFLTRSIVT